MSHDIITVAIDQSFTCSGIVVLRNTNMIHAECYRTTKEDDIFTRAWNITTRVRELVEQHNPDIVAMEGLAFGGKGNATRDLAGLQFVIATQVKFVCDTKVTIVAPGTVKKVATGKGNSPKMMLLECLPPNIHQAFIELGVKKTTGILDLTDAYWIGRTAEHIHQHEK
jgi:Holliday junction resolvasome RuvABC endonuclease subunit